MAPLVHWTVQISKAGFTQEIGGTAMGHSVTILLACVSPWYNRHGWLGVQNQLSIYLLTWVSAVFAVSDEVGELPFNGFQALSAHFNHELLEEFLIRDSALDTCMLKQTAQLEFLQGWSCQGLNRGFPEMCETGQDCSQPTRVMTAFSGHVCTGPSSAHHCWS